MKFLRYFAIGAAAVIGLIVVVLAAILLLRPPKNSFPNEHLAFENRLVIPPLLKPRLENGEKVFDLTVEQGETDFSQEHRTSTLGFNGTYLGPTIRANTGDKVRMNVTNTLSESTSVHWHGMHLPAAMDGGPHQIVEAGASWHPNWTITNEAATLWYHPHLMGKTGEQVYRGLAGLFLIDDANSTSLTIPNEYGVDDIPLLVQDRKFDSSGQFVYDGLAPGDALPAPAGMLGDTILVNGTGAPFVEVPQKLVRLRLVNGSSGRRYNFGFSDSRPFQVIATEGGLLEAPVETTRLVLGASERAEILVDLHETSDPLTLMSYPVEGVESSLIAFIRGFFGQDDQGQQFKILELRPQAGGYPDGAVPPILNKIERLDQADAVQTRRFNLDARTINNKSMDHTRVDEIVQKGDVEIWELQNQSPFYHPFHIHAVQFLVLTRDGKTPPAFEQGWKDTVIVNPSETVRVIMQFTGYSDPTLPYMFHCHILEHEDIGMMGQFVVVDDPSDAVNIQSPLTDPNEHSTDH